VFGRYGLSQDREVIAFIRDDIKKSAVATSLDISSNFAPRISPLRMDGQINPRLSRHHSIRYHDFRRPRRLSPRNRFFGAVKGVGMEAGQVENRRYLRGDYKFIVHYQNAGDDLPSGMAATSSKHRMLC
jgi:hypothetical protein